MAEGSAVKEEGSHHHVIDHLMGFASNSTSSSTFRHNNHHHPYMDQQFPLTPTAAVQEINANPFLYPPQNLHPLRDFDHQQPPYDNQVVVFKPEPLSLSLSSSQPTNQHTQQTQNNTNNNNLQRFSSPGINYDSLHSGVSVAFLPFGPFTGYASILKGSRFLKPAQHLLEEFCDVGSREIYSAKVLPLEDSSFFDPPIESFGDDDSQMTGGDGGESRRQNSRLISMLDEVYRRYKQYYQQMQAVARSFEYVAGLGNAAPYANLAIKAMARHFKCLKNAITEQLHLRSRNATHLRPEKDGNLNKLVYHEARVRLWKPMVEEIHMLETRQAQKTSQRVDLSSNRSSDDHLPSPNSLGSENPSTSTHRVQDTASKRTRRELHDHITMEATEQNVSYNNFPSHMHVGHVGMNMAGASSSGVSLTLGLHQNNGNGFSDPFPINAAQRFGLGLDGNGENYAMGGFEAQNRHFERDVMGGQFLHDFVG
ncbi:hypothetical protein C1H46_019894 [Malus baccata]|uniref:POX domain-containing protein n=1 Tax=Malus baccata TaxID=106549 RepID=A0A540M6U2_MALBA|nr:hypothetical protein C1H46_019894 [Malus baccata]